MTYVKLFADILASSIWAEPDHVRIVWITMLAMASRDGDVLASVPGLAHLARVNLAQCEEALEILSAPDAHSRTKSYEGRRIAPITGGWNILNYEFHRDRMSLEEKRQKDADRQKRKYDRDKAKREASVREREDREGSQNLTIPPEMGDGDASESSGTQKGESAERGKRPDDVPPDLWSEWLDIRRNKKKRNTAKALSRVLNKWTECGVSAVDGVRRCVEKEWAQWDPSEDRRSWGRTGAQAKEHIRNTPLGHHACSCPDCAAFKQRFGCSREDFHTKYGCSYEEWQERNKP